MRHARARCAVPVEGAIGRGADADQDALLGGCFGDHRRATPNGGCAGEPVWRILGEREFWGLPFALSSGTLEPRPDSETLVEAALALLGPRRDEPLVDPRSRHRHGLPAHRPAERMPAAPRASASMLRRTPAARPAPMPSATASAGARRSSGRRLGQRRWPGGST